MEKIILRKDYKTRAVPVEESIGHYLAKRAARTWTEDFIDEDTKETVTIDRCEVFKLQRQHRPTLLKWSAGVQGYRLKKT